MTGQIACTATADRFRCPTKWDLWRQTMALLPRGRAWQSHEEIVERFETGHNSQVGTFEVGVTGIGAEPVIEDLTRLEQYWAAHAEVLEYLHQRACALIEEFFCATTVEQRAEWGIDYGFPDPCEPWEHLCDKVAAQGGATCDYLAEVAWRRGWAIRCRDCLESPGATADCAVADCAAVCTCPPNTLWIEIDMAASPAAVSTPVLAISDMAVAGCNVTCPPEVAQLVCLIERIKPAHIRAHFVIKD